MNHNGLTNATEDALIAGARSGQQVKMLMKTSERRKDIANAKTIPFWLFGRDPH